MEIGDRVAKVTRPGDLFEERPCPRCDCCESELFVTAPDVASGSQDQFFISRCLRCDLAFQNPSVKAEHVGRYYSEDYQPYSLPEMRISRTALRYLVRKKGYGHLAAPSQAGLLQRLFAQWTTGAQMLPDFVPGGRLLEIGCSSGERLSLLRTLGWQHCLGIEFNAGAAQKAQQRGFDVYVGLAEREIERIREASLDVVIAGSVLEHVKNPFSHTQAIARKLKPGGQFILSTIVIDSPDFKIYREFWYNLDLPRHFTFFRKRDLREMLAKHFQILGIFHQYSVNDYAGSARLRARMQKRFFDKLVLASEGRLAPFCLVLALTNHSSRVCIHARRSCM